MNKKISTNSGLITGISIMAYILILHALHVPNNSPIVFGQFAILFLGILTSCFLLYKYYTDIQFIDAFIHGVKTGITSLVIILFGTSILYFVFTRNAPFSAYTFMIMKSIFAFTVSGILSAFFSSFIFNTFTKKK